MDPLGAEDGPAGGEDHQEDHHDAEQDEGAGPEGEVLQVVTCQRARHGRRLPAVLNTAPQSCTSPPPVTCSPTSTKQRWFHQVILNIYEFKNK